jgi:simple sugar transport system ATP-binding protein
VLALGDRIAVMFRGRIVGVVPPTTSREQIGLMMAGVETGTPAQPAGDGRLPGSGTRTGEGS